MCALVIHIFIFGLNIITKYVDYIGEYCVQNRLPIVLGETKILINSHTICSIKQNVFYVCVYHDVPETCIRNTN